MIIDLTIEEIEQRLESIMDEYEQGSDQVYRINWDGKAVMLTPFNGPWEETIQKDEEGNMVVPLPNRVLNKYGIKEGDDIKFEVKDESIILYLEEKED